ELARKHVERVVQRLERDAVLGVVLEERGRRVDQTTGLQAACDGPELCALDDVRAIGGLEHGPFVPWALVEADHHEKDSSTSIRARCRRSGVLRSVGLPTWKPLQKRQRYG